MKVLEINKSIVLFYLSVLVCSYVFIWRIERLEEVKIEDKYIVYNEKIVNE